MGALRKESAGSGGARYQECAYASPINMRDAVSRFESGRNARASPRPGPGLGDDLGGAPSALACECRGLIAEERTVSRLAPVLHNSAEAPGVVGHDAVDAGPDQGTEVAAVINRPDNEAHARQGWARGVDRIAPLEFRQEKISPRLEGHD
jgi:hypothetical protein